MLEKTDTRRIDIVVLSVRQVTQAASGEHPLDASQIFSVDETDVFTKVVNLAEKAGKHVELMVVPGSDPYAAIVATAQRLQSSRIVMGLSPKMSPAEQGATVGREWEDLPEPRPSLSMEIVVPGEDESVFFNLGPHPPRLWPQDLDLLHQSLAGAFRQRPRLEAAPSRHRGRGAAPHAGRHRIRPRRRGGGGCDEGSRQRVP